MPQAGYGKLALSRPTVLALAFVALLGTIAALPASAAAAGLKVTPTSLAFGNVVFGVTGATSVAHTVTISDPAAGLPISSLSIQLTGANSGDFQISDNTCGATLSKGSNCTLKVTFTPTALGARSATLAVSDDANLNAGSAALSGTGIAGKLTIRPLTSSFGKVLVGATSAAKMTTVENPTAATFQIASVVASGEFTIASDTCSGDELPPGASCAVKAVFNPTQTGALSGNLIITDDAANSPQSVTLEGSGILANPTFSPLSLAFGRVQVGFGVGRQDRYDNKSKHSASGCRVDECDSPVRIGFGLMRVGDFGGRKLSGIGDVQSHDRH